MRLNPPSTGLASLVMFVAASLWGLYWVPLRQLEALGIEGAWSIALLNLPAAFALFVVTALSWKQYRGFGAQMLVIGLFTGAGLALYGSGLVLSSVVRATLLFYLMPVWATLIGVFWLGERAAWQRWAAILAGLIGMLMLLSGGGSVPLNIGDLLAILSGMFWSVGAAMIMRFQGVPVPGMVGVQFLFTSLIAVLLGVLTSTATFYPPPSEALVTAMPLIFGISIVAFLPAVCLIFWVQKYLFPGRAGLLMMSEVLMAVLSASIFLPEERMSAVEWGGAVLIIGACLAEVLLTPQQTRDAETV